MKLYPTTVTLAQLCTPGHAVNTTVDQERFLVKVGLGAEICIYEQLSPRFWKNKTLGLNLNNPVWRTGMAPVTAWVTYVDLV